MTASIPDKPNRMKEALTTLRKAGLYAAANLMEETWDDYMRLLREKQDGLFPRPPIAQPQELRGEKRARYIHEHDCPKAWDFFTKHGLGSKVCPSCLMCGQQRFDREEWAITHLELPDIYICMTCVAAARSAKTPPIAPRLLNDLEDVASALDVGLGDTDITHIESDEELRDEHPIQWACSRLNRVIQELSAPTEREPQDVCPDCHQTKCALGCPSRLP